MQQDGDKLHSLSRQLPTISSISNVYVWFDPQLNEVTVCVDKSIAFAKKMYNRICGRGACRSCAPKVLSRTLVTSRIWWGS
jgi:hypothetical protein